MNNCPQRLDSLSLTCGEGPVWDPVCQRLFWTDSGGETVYVYDTATGEHGVAFSGTHAGALTLHARGGLMLGGVRGFFTWIDQKIATAGNSMAIPGGEIGFHGRTVRVKNINEIIADPAGRVFGGQEAYTEQGSYERGFLFRLDLDGRVTIVEEGLHNSNGMGFSPDLSSFYLTDTIPRHIYRYDYDLASGEIKNRRLLIRLSAEQGLPDGLTVDREGYLWVASWFGSCLYRFDPDGSLERTIRLPFAQPTSLTFGGKDYNEIFITSAAARWETPLAPPGHDYDFPRGGGLYRIRQDIVGLPEYRAWVWMMIRLWMMIRQQLS